MAGFVDGSSIRKRENNNIDPTMNFLTNVSLITDKRCGDINNGEGKTQNTHTSWWQSGKILRSCTSQLPWSPSLVPAAFWSCGYTLCAVTSLGASHLMNWCLQSVPFQLHPWSATVNHYTFILQREKKAESRIGFLIWFRLLFLSVIFIFFLERRHFMLNWWQLMIGLPSRAER